MKTKLLSVFLVILALLSSCQSDYFELQNDESSLNSYVVSRTATSYFPNGWQSIINHEEKIAALQLPDSLLKQLSTEELVEVCMSYPLALECFAFNDFKFGTWRVIQSFNGFAELKNRKDALDKIINFYSRKLDEIELFGTSKAYKFKPLTLSFYEYFITSGFLISTEDLKKLDKLNLLFNKSLSLRNTFSQLNGNISTKAFSAIKETLSQSSLSRNGYISDYFYVYSNNGLPVLARMVTCLDQSIEMQEGLDFINAGFPDVEIIDEATCRYNCHAFAWYITEGGEEYWIDQRTESGGENISNFWNDGTYKETTYEYAEKIFYPTYDHSAIAMSQTMYISKWGAYHLVRHHKTNCPYYSTGLRYFTKNMDAPGINDNKPNPIKPDPIPTPVEPPFKEGEVYWDMIPDPTPLNSYEKFYISDYYDTSKYRISIFISNPKDQEEPIEDRSRAYITSSNETSATVYFASPGIYYVCFFIYSKTTGNCIAKYTSKEVYVS